MTKAEEYQFQKSRLRHPTFLQDLIEKKKTTKKVKNGLKPVVVEDKVWTPENPVTEEKLKSGTEIFKTDIKKKIWG